jgi:hypothetical protein
LKLGSVRAIVMQIDRAGFVQTLSNR